MSKIFTSILLLYIWFPSYAQLTYNLNHAQAVSIQQSTLLVALCEPDKTLVKWYTKKDPQKLKSYLNQIDSNNVYLQRAVRKYWTFSSLVEFHPKDEAIALQEKNKNKYSMLQVYMTPMVNGGYSSGPFNTMPQLFISGHSNYVLQPLPVSPTDENTDSFNFLEIAYAIRQIQYYCTTMVKEENKKNKISIFNVEKFPKPNLLRDKTLLINRDDTDYQLTEALIQEVYPYPFRLASATEISNAILEGDARYACTISIVRQQSHFRLIVFDAENGSVYSEKIYLGRSMMGKTSPNGKEVSGLIQLRCIKDIVEESNLLDSQKAKK